MGVKWELNDILKFGTSLQGHITATYAEVVETFGEPNLEPSDKTWNEWGIEFEIGDPEDDDWDTVNVTIYDWKEQSASDAMYGKYQWHIGGKTHQAVELVFDAMGK